MTQTSVPLRRMGHSSTIGWCNMVLDTKPPVTVLAMRWSINALAIAGTICLIGYVIPWVVFWAIHSLLAITITMSAEHVVALWVLIFILGFMDKVVVALSKK